jgi:hypothetical protein
MMKDMVKEIAGGLVFLGGVVLVVTTAETLPVVAGIGAVTSLGAGVYQAYTSAHRTKLAKEAESNSAARRAS